MTIRKRYFRITRSIPIIALVIIIGLDGISLNHILEQIRNGTSLPELESLLQQLISRNLIIGGVMLFLGIGLWIRDLMSINTIHDHSELLHTIINNIPDLVYAKDTKGRFLVANQALAESMGVSNGAALIGKSDFDFHARNLAEQFHAEEQALLNSGRALTNHSEKIVHADGSERWLLSTKVPIRKDNGQLIGLVGINRDVTELRESEARIDQERRLLRSIIDNSPDLIYVKDTDACFLVANQATVELFGVLSVDELLGKSDFDFFERELAEQYYADDRRVIDTGESVIEREEPLSNLKTGEQGWLLTSKKPLYDDNGNVMGMMGIGRNITRLKIAAITILKSTTQIQEAANQQTESVGEQDTALANTMSVVEQLRQSATLTAERTQEVARIAQLSVDVSNTGEIAVADTIRGMAEIRSKVEHIAQVIQLLAERTQEVGNIIETVNELADQSKILALNAHIEAARSGEAGKGFAVVAMEIRRLAEMSQKSTTTIRRILTEIQTSTDNAVTATKDGTQQVNSGTALVQKAGESIQELTHHIARASQATDQIAATTQEQVAGMNSLVNAMTQIDTASKQLAASIHQTEEELTALLKLAQETERIGQTLN